MSEYNTGGDPISERIAEASTDPYLEAAADEDFLSPRRKLRYDKAEVIKLIGAWYDLTEQQVRVAWDICDQETTLEQREMPDELEPATLEDQARMMANEYGGPLTGNILKIDEALTQSQANIRQASKDYRMKAIVAFMSSDGNSTDYEFIGEILDDIERQYKLFPIEVIEAYDICEQRLNYAKMELINE